jgi:senataxin
MVDDLQPVFTASLKFLRLTEMELLHQSCKLVESLFDVFRECRVSPNPETIGKLKQILEQARAAQASKKDADMQSRLNESQISLLTLKIKGLESGDESDDDDITFLGMSERKQEPEEVTFLGITQQKKEPKRTASVSLTRSDATMDQKPVPRPQAGPSSAKSGFLSKPALPAMPRAPGALKELDQPAQTKPRPIVTPGTRPTKPPPPPTQQIDQPVQGKPFPIVSPAIRPIKPSPSLQQDSVTPTTSRPSSHPSSRAASSSSESESEGERGIAALDKHQRSPVKVKVRRGIKLLDGPVKQNNVVQPRYTPQEQAQRQAMRLRPDVSGLYKMILQWDYDHTGSDPPDIDKLKPHLQTVPKTFKSPEHYFHTFEPLLRLECWSQLMKSKDESLQQVRCRINGKGFVDQYLEMQVSIQQTPEPGWFLSDTDIVLLRRASGGRSLLGKVQEMKRTKLITAVVRFHNSAILQKEAPSLEQDFLISRVFR